MITRFVITHVGNHGLRRLTFAQQARNTYDTRALADAALTEFRGPDGLCRVLSPAEMESLQVREVNCYDHGDPVAYYYEDASPPPYHRDGRIIYCGYRKVCTVASGGAYGHITVDAFAAWIVERANALGLDLNLLTAEWMSR